MFSLSLFSCWRDAFVERKRIQRRFVQGKNGLAFAWVKLSDCNIGRYPREESIISIMRVLLDSMMVVPIFHGKYCILIFFNRYF